jgi:hypothetical protein
MGLRKTVFAAIPRLTAAAVKVGEHELLLTANTAILFNSGLNGRCQECRVQDHRSRVQGRLTLENNR